MRILVAGDWHGNRAWAGTCFAVAAAEQADAVLQLGDFGLWPGREDAWLDHVDEQARRAGTKLVWIDGNHEDHDRLDEWRAKADDRGLVAMRDHVQWASRGARWEWSGVRFGALGGAVSIDRFLRRPGVNWWAQEAPTASDVERLGAAPLDVLVTHAAPTTSALTPRRLRLPRTVIEDSLAARSVLDQAVAQTRPRLVLHGHYHLRLHAVMDGYTVDGLAHDKSTPADALGILDLAQGLDLQPPGRRTD